MDFSQIDETFRIKAQEVAGASALGSFNTLKLPDHKLDGVDFKYSILDDLKFKDLFDRTNKIQNSSIYWFSLESAEEAKRLNELLDGKRNESKSTWVNERKVPPKNANNHSAVFYVGIRKGGVRKKRACERDGLTNISGRLVQHLGYYEIGTTQGLQFLHWAKGEDFKVNFHVVEFEKDMPPSFLNIMEKYVAEILRPLCGKH